MKKFYCKKEDSKDKTPIVLRLERRHTMDATEDKIQDERRKFSARAASISGLDMLTDGPSRPRERVWEVTKCLSEDVLSKGQSKVAKRVITEAELSSSWLYKSMQESVNARFKSPVRTPIPNIPPTGDPVVLQDPKMKPVPVKSSRFSKKSCCCKFATIMAICLCTVGFLAAFAGIIYMEVFANKNLTSYETPENVVDLSELVVESQEGHNGITARGFSTGKEQNVQKSSDITTDTKKDSSLKKTEDHTGENLRILNTKTPVTELNKYLNSENTKIKFQDGETVIYEVKPSDSMEYEESFNNLDDFKGRSLVNFSETDDDNSIGENGSKDVEGKLGEKLSSLETYSDLQVHKMEEESEGGSDEKPQDSIPKKTNFEGNLKEIVSHEAKHAVPETFVESDESITKLNFPDSSETEHGTNFVDIGPTLDPKKESSEIQGGNKIQSFNVVAEDYTDKVRASKQNLELHHEMKILPSVQYADQDEFSDNKQKSELHNELKILPSVQYVDQDEFSDSKQKSQLHHEVKILPSVQYVDQNGEFSDSKQKPQLHHEGKILPSIQYVDQDGENEEVKTDHDVDSMIMVVDDPEEEESDDSFISNRNGDIIPFETTTSKFTANPTSMEPVGNNFVSEANKPQTSTPKQFTDQPILSKTSVDMRVQLAEAMKHLQVLDANNRILMSRKKTIKPKVNMKKRKQSIISQKEQEAALEKMKYLQRVRLMMYDQLQ